MIPLRAFTLLETMISSVILGVLVVASLGAVGQLARAQRLQQAGSEGDLLARLLADEIGQARGRDPDTPDNWGPETGETGAGREDFDDIDDYDGWTAGPPRDRAGAILPGYAGWQRSVVVTPVTTDTLGAVPTDGGLVRATVTVTDPGGAVSTATLLRCTLDLDAPIVLDDATAVVGVTIRLTTGDDGEVTREVPVLPVPAEAN